MAKKNSNGFQTSIPQGQIHVQPIEEVMPGSMLPYAEFVILDRALPRVEDGLKPVQRRILYTMYEMGLTPDKPHKKSARIVGDCMGKYHPHGDSSVYDAMVRMAQPFNMRMTLVNGHGNFGSVDGDPAAAMRYTEARLEPLALELLKDLEKETVPFSFNFDDSLLEPDLLPGHYPNLLVNGANGIAVGLATNIPTHNLGEVIDGCCAYIDNPRISLGEMMKIIPGPDFSTGGYIIANELKQAYETGKGKITLRAKYSVEQGENGKKQIIITELPYQTNKAELLRKIMLQREEKKELLAGISEIVDESDRQGMRAVITVKKDADCDVILNTLLKCTDLECTFGINMVAIAGGKPRQLGLLDIIKYYTQYQQKVVVRRCRHELKEAEARCHILEGLIIGVHNVDEVVKIIKTSESTPDARRRLMERFALSEKQAQAILDLRLARLAKL
ncbi:MAG: DNA gyrase subunit A, partial [Clostridia bacterium]|nr:DNA gyrase subunit A [Clostridia bacterium]